MSGATPVLASRLRKRTRRSAFLTDLGRVGRCRQLASHFGGLIYQWIANPRAMRRALTGNGDGAPSARLGDNGNVELRIEIHAAGPILAAEFLDHGLHLRGVRDSNNLKFTLCTPSINPN